MSYVPETLVGKPRQEWTPAEHQAVCVATGAAGWALWILLLLSIQVLRPGLDLPWGGVMMAGILFGGGLTWRAWRLLPPPKAKPARPALEKREAPRLPEEEAHERKWLPARLAGWNRLFPILGVLSIIWGGVYLAGFMRFNWGVPSIELLWRSSGGLLAMAGAMAFFQRRVSRWVQMAAWGTVAVLALLTLGVSLPYNPMNHPSTIRFILKFVCLTGFAGGLFIFFTRPFAREHYRR